MKLQAPRLVHSSWLCLAGQLLILTPELHYPLLGTHTSITSAGEDPVPLVGGRK
jgi:hypothetical protein